MAEQLERRSSSKSGELRYLLYLPDDYHEEPERMWPLLVFLHGWGESGDDLELLKRHGVPKLIERSSAIPFVTVSPQAPEGIEWQELTALLAEFVNEAATELNIDRGRIYLTGLSTGGTGAWALAVDNPTLFAAVVPMAADAPDVERFMERVADLRDVPIWVVHGAKDDIYPLEIANSIVDRLRSAGCNVRFTIYQDAGHVCWEETYDSSEFYEWLLDQSLTG